MASETLKIPYDRSLSYHQVEVIHLVTQKAHSLGMPLFLVGGIVRDLVLGIKNKDLDFVVEGDAVLLARSLVHDHGGKLTAHSRFRTATIETKNWNIENKNSPLDKASRHVMAIDLITARQETYPSPSSLPRVKPGSILDDLRRRDFTINSMAIRLDGPQQGTLLDPLGGQVDLKQRKVRILHSNSFVDDPTRIFRAFRYKQRFNFKLAQETIKSIPGGRKFIASLTPERVRHELDLILEERSAPVILARLAEYHLLTSVHPSLRWNDLTSKRFEFKVSDDLKKMPEYSSTRIRWVLWVINVSKLQIASLNTRLHFDADLYRTMIAASNLWKQIKVSKKLKPSQWVERLEKLPALAVMAVYLADNNKVSKQALQEYLVEWRHVKPLNTGHDLKVLGIKPGKQYSIILRRLRSAWLDGEISNAAQERKFLENLLK